MLLFGAMTFADTSYIYLEQEELLEGRELELEELKEKSDEGKEKIKWPFSGGSDHFIGAVSYRLPFQFECTLSRLSTSIHCIQKSSKKLFIIYCCPKIPVH